MQGKQLGWCLLRQIPFDGVSEVMITEMTAVGGLLILGIGTTMLDIKRLPATNLLPAIFVAPVLGAVSKLVFG